MARRRTHAGRRKRWANGARPLIRPAPPTSRPGLPVAVITAGASTTTALKQVQMIPAVASRNGYIEHVAGAGHASLLGRRFADPIVRGVEHVLASAHR